MVSPSSISNEVGVSFSLIAWPSKRNRTTCIDKPCRRWIQLFGALVKTGKKHLTACGAWEKATLPNYAFQILTARSQYAFINLRSGVCFLILNWTTALSCPRTLRLICSDSPPFESCNRKMVHMISAQCRTNGSPLRYFQKVAVNYCYSLGKDAIYCCVERMAQYNFKELTMAHSFASILRHNGKLSPIQCIFYCRNENSCRCIFMAMKMAVDLYVRMHFENIRVSSQYRRLNCSDTNIQQLIRIRRKKTHTDRPRHISFFLSVMLPVSRDWPHFRGSNFDLQSG